MQHSFVRFPRATLTALAVLFGAATPALAAEQKTVAVTAIVEHPALDAARDGVKDELKAAGRLLTTDWTSYSGEHVVYRPAKMTVEELYWGHKWAKGHFYSYRSIGERMMDIRTAIAILDAFLQTPFEGGRHEERIRELDA